MADARDAGEARTDFGKHDNIRNMGQAIAQVIETLGLTQPALLDGEPCTTGATFDSLNPSSPDEVIARFPECGAAEAERAVTAAAARAEEWRRVDAGVRARILEGAAESLRRRRFEIAAWLCLETGLTWRQADAELFAAVAALEAADPSAGTACESTAQEGVAVVAGSRWSPLASVTSPLAAALRGGRTVVFQPARSASLAGWKLVDALIDAGMAPTAIQFLTGDALGSFPARAPVATGSTLQHRYLGEEVDAGEAASAAVERAFLGAGPARASALHLFVQDAAYAPVAELLIDRVAALQVGPAVDLLTEVGPLPEAEDVARWERVVGRLAEGRVRCGGVGGVDLSPLAAAGYFVAPTLVEGVPIEAGLPGPLVALTRVGGPEDMSRILERQPRSPGRKPSPQGRSGPP